MEPALISLLAASIAFTGGHFAMSHPLRDPMVRTFGEKGFLGVYSILILAAFAWMALAFRTAQGGAPAWNGSSHAAWAAASLLTLVALVLFFGALKGNPALPDTPVEKIAAQQAHGVFKVTRHPMMWGFALWAVAHILVMPTARTVILAGAILILALVGAHLQDRRKQAALGPAWAHWEAQTSYWPHWSRLARTSPALWIAAVLAWLGVTWAHLYLAGIAAGIWLWVK